MEVFLIFSYSKLHAQFQHYDSRQGLSQNSVYHIIQDKKGFLWIATSDGLNRFDGHQFLRLDEFATGNIPYSFEGGILEDENENLWMAGKSGLYYYDRLKNKVSSKNHFLTLKKLNTGAAIIGRNQNTLWFLFEYNYLVSLDIKTGKIKNYSLRNRLIQYEGIISICFYKEKLIICTSFGIRLFDPNKDELTEHLLGKKTAIAVVKPISEHTYYIGGDGLYIWNVQTNELKPIVIKETGPLLVTDIIEKEGKLYIGTLSQGLIIYDLKKEKLIKKYSHNKDEPASISFDLIRKLYIDKTRQIWIGTDGGGLNKLDINPPKFNLYRSGYDGQPKFSSDFIKCIYVTDSRKIWFGTHGFGLNVYDPILKTVKITNSQNSKLKGDIIISIYKDSKQRIWILTDNGIFQSDENLSFFKSFEIENLKFEKGKIYLYQLLELSDGHIILSTENGLTAFDEKNQFFYICSDNGFTPIVFIQDTKTTLVGTDYSGTTFQFDIKKPGTLTELVYTKKVLVNTKIRSFVKQGNTVFAASEKGLIQFSNNYKTVRHYNKKQNLNNLFLYGMLSDNKGNIWVSSNLGISKFDTSNNLFQNYTIEDNLQSSEFNTNAFFKTRDGEFYFGGINGFNSFYPDRLFINQAIVPICLSSIKINGKPVMADSLLKLKKIEFDYTQNNIDLTFSLLDFTSPTKVQYFYSVSDTGSNWISLGNARGIILSNLAPGQYTVWVKAINNDGVSLPKTQLISFIIHPPYYKTWWFITIISLLFLGISTFIIWYFSYQKLKIQLAENKRETEVLQLKQNISRDLHDHLGANLSRLSLLTQRLANKNNTETGANNLQNISSLTTEMNKQISELVWSVNEEYDNLESLLSYIRGYASTFLEEIDMPFSFQFDYPQNQIKLNPIAKQTLFSITKEALNNISKYSKATLVTISFKLTNEEEFIYSIHDNGIGFDEGKIALFSNGIKNMKARCADAGFQFQLETGPDSGVKIILKGTI